MKLASKVIARSASDETDDWPAWFLANGSQTSLNVTQRVAAELGHNMPFGAIFVSREDAQKMAGEYNER
jgi:excinuclease UvrABC nuclease subunit